MYAACSIGRDVVYMTFVCWSWLGLANSKKQVQTVSVLWRLLSYFNKWAFMRSFWRIPWMLHRTMPRIWWWRGCTRRIGCKSHNRNAQLEVFFGLGGRKGLSTPESYFHGTADHGKMKTEGFYTTMGAWCILTWTAESECFTVYCIPLTKRKKWNIFSVHFKYASCTISFTCLCVPDFTYVHI